MEFKALYVNEIGENGDAFSYAGTDENGQILKEVWDRDFNTSIVATGIILSHQRSGGKKMQDFSIADIKITTYITDSRLVICCTKYDKGGGWYGGGLVSVGANIISKARANARSKGTIMLGQVRYEWLSHVGFIRKTGWMSTEQLRIVYSDTDKTQWYIDLTFDKYADTSSLANDIVHRAARYRLAMSDEKDAIELEFFNKYSTGAKINQVAEPNCFAMTKFPNYFPAPIGGKNNRPVIT